MNALAHYYAAAASAFHEIFYHKLPEKLFRGIIPEKYRYFPGNFRKNSAGNFRKFPNSQPYLSLLILALYKISPLHNSIIAKCLWTWCLW